MPPTPNIGLPYLAANQAQKHVTVNESLRMLDAVVQLGVESAALATPPASPAEGQDWIVPAAPTGAWAGQAGKIAAWQDGTWAFYTPREGWIAWDKASAQILIWRATTSLWAPLISGFFADSVFTLQDDVDPTKQARFQLSGLSTGITRSFTLPNGDGALTCAGLTTSITGAWTFSASSSTFGSSAGTASYGLGTGATTSGLTKTLNIGTAGLSGSTTNIALGSAVAGAAGTLTVNSPSVVFASSVSSIAMAAANVTALYLGLGGATADATNRLSLNAPATLLNHAGAGHEVTINKAASANDAALAFKTGFSARALMGLLGADDWRLKVSPDGATFLDAMVADRASGRVRFPVGLALSGLASDPASPADGWLWHNATTGQLKAQLGGATRVIADRDIPWLQPGTGDYVLTTTGAGGGATGTLAGTAGRIDLFPFIPGADVTIDRMTVNVTTLIAAALGKIVLYSADAAGRPATLILETGDLDFSTTGLKEATVALTLRKGITYWLGIRHNSTATLSAWAGSATPDLNGGAPSTAARKVLRRTLAYATAAPATWGFFSSEIASSIPATAIWLRAA